MRRLLAIAIVTLFVGPSALAENLVSNPEFNTNTMGWTPLVDMTANWDARDRIGTPSSGSLLATTLHSHPSEGRVIVQCVATTPGTRYRIAGSMMFPSDQTRTPESAISVAWLSGLPCNDEGPFVGFDYGPIALFSEGTDVWRSGNVPTTAPATGVLARINLQVNPREGSGVAKILFDGVVLEEIPPIPDGDFDINTHSEILWHNNATGANVLWHVNGATLNSAVVWPPMSNIDWKPMGVGKLHNPASSVHESVAWRNAATGHNLTWNISGMTATSPRVLPEVANLDWKIVGMGDLSGDIRDDLVWWNQSTGGVVLWKMFEGGVGSTHVLPTVADTNWRIVAVADFDGDVREDIFWRNSVSGSNVIWFMNGHIMTSWAFVSAVPDVDWKIVGTGDFQGDRKADLIWRNGVTGSNAVWLMNGGTVAGGAVLPTVADTNWKIVQIGDFQGDEKSDLLWRNQVTGANAVWMMDGLAVSTAALMPSVSDTNWSVVSKP